jgi:uncharacterized membrane protein YidH (DUF202 family)
VSNFGVDQWPRTLLAWQRTLLAFAGAALAVTAALAVSGRGVWALPCLVLAALPVPTAVRREQQLRGRHPLPVRMADVRVLTGSVVGFAIMAAVAAMA